MARGCCLAALCALVAFAPPARAHNVYVAIDNHTDYGWNATTAVYDATMLADLDYYLAQIDATAMNAPNEQMRFSADCWWWVYLYEHNRSAAQFTKLMDAMRTGHITVSLNPFVTLYGALPTEAAIRAGYYPGRLERKYSVPFTTAQEMENQTIPWGVSSVWSWSGVNYSWKGICACTSPAPGARTDEVFRWQGPDSRELLMKWYFINGSANSSYGGYAEARDNLSASAVDAAIAKYGATLPVGVFGAGWDDVGYQKNDLVALAQSYNLGHANDKIVVSNEADYFSELEAHRASLPAERGGWGNDWDLWPAALAERTAQARRAVERLRTGEALASVAHLTDATFWTPQQSSIELAFIDYFKYTEHSWGTTGGVTLASLEQNKKTWAQTIDLASGQLDSAARAKVAGLFTTPNEDRFAVFNPLGFSRTDVADLQLQGAGPYVVTDVTTGLEVPNQVVTINGTTYLRILVTDVPSLGWRSYRYASGTPAVLPAAATVTGSTIESSAWKVVLGGSGQITSAIDKSAANRELAGAGLDDFGGGTAGAATVENAGPVSVTLRSDVAGTPARSVRVTLMSGVDRVEIEDQVLANFTGTAAYAFDVKMTAPQLRFEEVGAIARPGLVAQGGDFLPGARTDWMTLNHFVSFSDASNYTLTVSNRDASFMNVNGSGQSSFALGGSSVSVLAIGNPAGAQISDQGGDTTFLDRFALAGATGAFSGAASMKASLRHSNPLAAFALGRNQTGPLTAATGSELAVSAPNVVVMAYKPAEEGGRGVVARIWELDGKATTFNLDVSALKPSVAFETSAIETDLTRFTPMGGQLPVSIGANEMKTFRFVPGSFGDVNTDGGTIPDLSPLPGDGADNPQAGDGGQGPGKGQGGCSCQVAASGLPVDGVLIALACLEIARRRRRVRAAFRA